MNSQTLKSIRIFRDLPAESLAQLEPKIYWKEVKRGQELISHLDVTNEVYFVAEGRLRTNMFSQSGREIILRDLYAGQTFGEFAALDGKPRAASVMAVTDSKIALTSAANFQEMLNDHPAIMKALLVETIGLVRHMTDKVFEFSALSVKARIHIELLRLGKKTPEGDDNCASIAPAPTHAEIANQIGSHREAITRELNKLNKEGIIKNTRSEIAILDVRSLADKASTALGISVNDFFPRETLGK